MAISPESLMKIDELRNKIRGGTVVSLEEYREAIRLMREDRVGAAATSANSRAKKAKAEKAANVSGDDLLKDFV